MVLSHAFLLYLKERLFLTSKDAYFNIFFLFKLPFVWTNVSLIVVLDKLCFAIR